MKITRSIDVNTGKFSSGLSAALSLIREMEQCPDGKCALDLSGSRFVTPLFVVPLCIYAHGCDERPTFEQTTDYMRNIHLDSWGVRPEAMGPAFVPYLREFERKSYMPLVSLPAAWDRSGLMDSVLDTLMSIIVVQSRLSSNVIGGLRYMFAEMSDNICEHSRAETGYVLAQCYPSLGFIDICIGDTGITLLGSYRSNGKQFVENDMDAIRSAIRGLSTKKLPDAENRGYGIHTTIRMIVSGLGGQYSMISGSAVYYNVPGSEGYSDIPYGIRFPGTVIAMRIPLSENNKFNFINFIE